MPTAKKTAAKARRAAKVGQDVDEAFVADDDVVVAFDGPGVRGDEADGLHRVGHDEARHHAAARARPS